MRGGETREPAESSLVLFGAFDRFNYGDLLFPHVLSALIQKQIPGRFRLKYVGLRQSNLGSAQAFSTHPVRWLLDPANVPEGSVVVVVGGEVLTADWAQLWHHHFPRNIGDPLYAVLRHSVGERGLSSIAKARFGVSWDIPFVIAPSDFRASVEIAYVSVGGTSFGAASDVWIESASQKLRQAASLSVRDAVTQGALLDAGVSADLVPDSAILISDILTRADLAARDRPRSHQVLESAKSGYICFQANRSVGLAHATLIADQLDQVGHVTGMEVVLLPLGYAAGHSDQVALRRIRSIMKRKPILPLGMGVLDTAMLLANARFFFGTSLHGTITAMSYGVPYGGISGVPKLEAFLKTWSIDPFDSTVELKDIVDTVVSRIDGNAEELCRQAMDLKQKAALATSELVDSWVG